MAIEAFLLAAFAQSSLLVSGLVVYRFTFSPKVIGCLAGFGAGALISAVSFDLIPEATELTTVESALGLISGAAIFVVADRLVESRTGGDDGNPLGIVIGAIVDGLPESLIFGIAVTTGDPISIAFVAAVWVSNVPQALAPSAALAKQGWSIGKTALMWGAVVVACALTAVFGYVLGENVSAATGAGAAAVAAGGVLAMLTDSLMPFAFEKGGDQAGVWTVVGFAVTLAMV
jgi:ZIP family zinc transporter